MKLWIEHWFGPVAAIRPYLFQKCFLLVVAFDLLVLMVERGGRYGLDAIPFNVPHFRWLDSFHQMFLSNGVPDATYYVVVVTLTSFLTFAMVWAGCRSWLMATVCLLYTYAWSMSRLDSYLHHYMISLILFCMIFFPAIDGRIFRRWIDRQLPSNAKRESTTVGSNTDKRAANTFGWLACSYGLLAISYRVTLSLCSSNTNYRWAAMLSFCAVVAALTWWWYRKLVTGSQFDSAGSQDAPNPDSPELATAGPLVDSWAVRLLATTVGVIYVFTSIAKMDAEWCGGYTLRAVGTTAQVLLPVEQLAAMIGISRDWFWAGLATFVIPLELTLAAVYLITPRQDEPGRVWLPRICMVGWLLAIGLHLNNEMMSLIIQWFGYYMLMLATVLLLPARILLVLGCLFYWPESWLRERYERVTSDLSSTQVSLAVGIVSFAAIASLAAFGGFVWILGGTLVAIVVCVGLVILLVIGLVAGWEKGSLKLSLTALGASLLMLLAVAQSSMRFDYYDLRGKTLQQLGNNEAAIKEMEVAAELPPPSREAASELHTNLGLAYRQFAKPRDAEKHYRKAIGLNPRQFLAHYSLANLMVSEGRHASAEEHYRKAIDIKSDFSDAYVNLGNVLEFQGQVSDAIQCYENALSIETDATDIQQMINSAKAKLPNGTSETE